MKKTFLTVLFLCLTLLTSKSWAASNKLIFGTEATYPPFEVKEKDVFEGFEIDLANEIAKRLGKQAEFVDMAFSNIFPSVSFGKIDVGISAIVETELRGKKFDFSIPYAYERKSLLYLKSNPYTSISSIKDKKVCVQLGTSMQIWYDKVYPNSKTVVSLDASNTCVENVKSKNSDVTVIDASQAVYFIKNNPTLGYTILPNVPKMGMVLVYKQGSALKKPIDKIINQMKQDGTLKKLHDKWLEMK